MFVEIYFFTFVFLLSNLGDTTAYRYVPKLYLVVCFGQGSFNWDQGGRAHNSVRCFRGF